VELRDVAKNYGARMEEAHMYISNGYDIQRMKIKLSPLRPFLLGVDTNAARSIVSPKKRQNWFSWAP
jgi:hypothetical protein